LDGEGAPDLIAVGEQRLADPEHLRELDVTIPGN
jgi:hypothetical protein